MHKKSEYMTFKTNKQTENLIECTKLIEFFEHVNNFVYKPSMFHF